MSDSGKSIDKQSVVSVGFFIHDFASSGGSFNGRTTDSDSVN